MRHYHWQPWQLEDLTPQQIEVALRDLQQNPPSPF